MKKAAKKLLVFLILLVIVTPSTIFASDKIDPYSQSSILIDQDTGRVLYQNNPDSKRPLASLSKMMTFLIAIEAIENKNLSINEARYQQGLKFLDEKSHNAVPPFLNST